MPAEIRTDGHCSCGKRVTHIANSIKPTCRTNGCRYIYPDQPDEGWDIFRCDGCGKVIDETFIAAKAA